MTSQRKNKEKKLGKSAEGYGRGGGSVSITGHRTGWGLKEKAWMRAPPEGNQNTQGSAHGRREQQDREKSKTRKHSKKEQDLKKNREKSKKGNCGGRNLAGRRVPKQGETKIQTRTKRGRTRKTTEKKSIGKELQRTHRQMKSTVQGAR